jgi:hypothetical protein
MFAIWSNFSQASSFIWIHRFLSVQEEGDNVKDHNDAEDAGANGCCSDATGGEDAFCEYTTGSLRSMTASFIWIHGFS